MRESSSDVQMDAWPLQCIRAVRLHDHVEQPPLQIMHAAPQAPQRLDQVRSSQLHCVSKLWDKSTSGHRLASSSRVDKVDRVDCRARRHLLLFAALAAPCYSRITPRWPSSNASAWTAQLFESLVVTKRGYNACAQAQLRVAHAVQPRTIQEHTDATKWRALTLAWPATPSTNRGRVHTNTSLARVLVVNERCKRTRPNSQHH